MLIAGLVALIVGSNFAVIYAEKIAILLKISELVIGLTIIAIGTSLPELAATISAVIKKKTDMVNSPAHYNETNIETIDVIQSVLGDGFDSYLQGNILKYMCRYKYKNGTEDLEKARWYLNRLIEVQVGEGIGPSREVLMLSLAS